MFNFIFISIIIHTPTSSEIPNEHEKFNCSIPLGYIPISNAIELQNINNNLSGYYYLTNDIDCSETFSWDNNSGFLPIGNETAKFNGTFDGMGFKINNLTINRTSDNFLGLFGYIDIQARIENVQVFNIKIIGNSTLGGLVGQNKGNISNCTIICSLSGNSIIGGLVGNNSGIINRTYSYSHLNGIAEIGGLVGRVWGGVVNNSHSTGVVNGSSIIGGLIAINLAVGKIYNSFSINEVAGFSNIGGLIGVNNATVLNCYWDNLTSGQTTSAAGVGLSTTNLMKKSTYVNWDFKDVWGIGESTSYPYLLDWYTNPEIITANVNVTYEDSIYLVNYTAQISSYPDYNGLYTWSMNTNISTSWLSIDNTGVLSGIPSNNDSGIFWITITVIDLCKGEDLQDFSLSVINTNDPPIIFTIKLLNGTEDVTYNFELNATDIDPTNDTLNWSIQTDASSWLDINHTSGTLFGTPLNNNVGLYWVNVTVKDNNGGAANRNYTLKIININDAPIITTNDIPRATEDLLYNVDYEAIDIDPTNDLIYWLFSTNAQWLTFNYSTAVLSGIPINKDVGTYWVNVTAVDNHSGTLSHNFTLIVDNVNDKPVINRTTIPKTFIEDEQIKMHIIANDIDPTNDILSWNLETNADWIKFNNTSSLLSALPTNDVADRTFWTNFSVSDDKGGYDEVNITIYVENVNDAPIIIINDIKIAIENQLYSVDYNAEDIDPTNDTLNWSLQTNTTWLNINESTGVVSGIPEIGDAGIYWVNITVNDGNGASDWRNFSLTVKPMEPLPENQNPLIITENELNAFVDETYKVDYYATDDKTPTSKLVWRIDTNASWLTFNQSTKTLTGTPRIINIGSYWVNITVLDTDGGVAFTNFTVTVKPSSIIRQNNKPILSNGKISPNNGDTETDFIFSVHYYDEDGDTPFFLRVIVDNSPFNLELSNGDPYDGTYKFDTRLSKGIHTYYFEANDGRELAITFDGTPISEDTAKTTSEVKEKKDDDGIHISNNTIVYLALIIIIIVILSLVLFALYQRKHGPSLQDKLEFFEDDVSEALIDEESEPIEQDPTKNDLDIGEVEELDEISVVEEKKITQ